MERKLTAILCADVYGYSRLLGEDEEATFRILSSHSKIIDGLIAHYRGRFVNSAGDSILAEFASVVNAVERAVEIQTRLKTENSDLPPERRMEFRIGVNLGDVIVDGEQLYGDGINVADVASSTDLIDGWYRTGERASVDSDGFLRMHGSPDRSSRRVSESSSGTLPTRTTVRHDMRPPRALWQNRYRVHAHE